MCFFRSEDVKQKIQFLQYLIIDSGTIRLVESRYNWANWIVVPRQAWIPSDRTENNGITEFSVFLLSLAADR